MNKPFDTNTPLKVVLINKNSEELFKTIIHLMIRFNDNSVFYPVAFNQLPPPDVFKRGMLTIVDDLYDNPTRLRLQELSLHPLRQIRSKQNLPPVAPITVPGVAMTFGEGIKKAPSKETPKPKEVIKEKPKSDKNKKFIPTKPAPALMFSPVLKKITEDQLYEFLLEQHQIYDKDLYTALIAPNLIVRFYNIKFPTDLDIDHVKRQLDVWVKSSDRVLYNPIRKKFRPKTR